MSNTERYLWYACYGSNLRAERFEIYLTGGSLRIDDHTVTEKGCREKNGKTRARPFWIFLTGNTI